MRKLPGDESLRIRTADLYKYSKEGRETAPISLVMTSLLLAMSGPVQWRRNGWVYRADLLLRFSYDLILQELYDFQLTLLRFKAEVRN